VDRDKDMLCECGSLDLAAALLVLLPLPVPLRPAPAPVLAPAEDSPVASTEDSAMLDCERRVPVKVEGRNGGSPYRLVLFDLLVFVVADTPNGMDEVRMVCCLAVGRLGTPPRCWCCCGEGEWRGSCS
jgi:hypothetical protein